MATHADSVRAREAALSTVIALRDAGHTAYFAGGCVRDELLDLEPADYDVATDARPDRIRSLFRRTAEVGASFGVVLVHDDGPVVEVATFRADGPYTDRRRPDTITFSDPVADAHRRDFTINALFLDPLDDTSEPRS
ncbi:MAG: CCA tRNA nucleotidyltransferase, partial [Planctomycetes bacterium]|nr:CCA tRNA nucleotidyltransferase [Planctomycetota bacterium]